MNRFVWEKRLLDSELPSPVRLVLLVLAVLADWPAGVTSREHTPSLTRLASKTGLGRSTVAQVLATAEAEGWLERERPDPVAARSNKERTKYRLIDVSTPRAGPSPGAGLVQELDQPASPGAGPSPGAGLELVQELDTGLVQELDTSHKRLPEAAISSARTPEAMIIERTGATTEEAAGIVARLRRDRPDIRSLAAVLPQFSAQELADRLADVRAASSRGRSPQPTCPTHRGQPAATCAPCRSERIGAA